MLSMACASFFCKNLSQNDKCRVHSSGDGGVWRISRLQVAVDKDPGKDCYEVSSGLLEVIASTLGCTSSLSSTAFSVIRKSLDARKEPTFVYTVDMDAEKFINEDPNSNKKIVSRLRQKQGKLQYMEKRKVCKDIVATIATMGVSSRLCKGSKRKAKVVVVGSGPAGLFAALTLTQLGVHVILIERGHAVEKRGRHIGRLIGRRILDPDSNFCYGEGGAGTWSDGKLTTKIGKNSDQVQTVLATLVRFGAPQSILIEGKPHIGTDKLVLILRNLRKHLQVVGVEIMFGSRIEDMIVRNGSAVGVKVHSMEEVKKSIEADAVVLAVGHSARDVYEMLVSHNVMLAPKDFAVGFRVEHPQELINEIQYGKWASQVERGKGKIPVADYKVAASVNSRGCYSFCMCPGGQIVPTSTSMNELCINGMSFSNRASKWANAALVVNVTSEDTQQLKEKHGALAGVEFQRFLEREASVRGGGNLVVPAQSLPDFLADKISGNPLPSTSYRLGIREAPLHDLLPAHLTQAIKIAIREFNEQLDGFIDARALVHGVETRTSSAVRIVRDSETYQSVSMPGLYPIGEGAGYAGGIVSAAVDGMEAAITISKQF